MPPHKRKFSLGEPVWGHVKGYPWWAGRLLTGSQVVRQDEDKPEPKPGEWLVEFFNDNQQYACLHHRRLRPFHNPRYRDVNKAYKAAMDEFDDPEILVQVDLATAAARDYCASNGWHDPEKPLHDKKKGKTKTRVSKKSKDEPLPLVVHQKQQPLPRKKQKRESPLSCLGEGGRTAASSGNPSRFRALAPPPLRQNKPAGSSSFVPDVNTPDKSDPKPTSSDNSHCLKIQPMPMVFDEDGYIHTDIMPVRKRTTRAPERPNSAPAAARRAGRGEGSSRHANAGQAGADDVFDVCPDEDEQSDDEIRPWRSSRAAAKASRVCKDKGFQKGRSVKQEMLPISGDDRDYSRSRSDTQEGDSDVEAKVKQQVTGDRDGGQEGVEYRDISKERAVSLLFSRDKELRKCKKKIGHLRKSLMQYTLAAIEDLFDDDEDAAVLRAKLG